MATWRPPKQHRQFVVVQVSRLRQFTPVFQGRRDACTTTSILEHRREKSEWTRRETAVSRATGRKPDFSEVSGKGVVLTGHNRWRPRAI
jgi:hypothetical protein